MAIQIDSYGRIIGGGGSPTAPPPTTSGTYVSPFSGSSTPTSKITQPAPTQPVPPPPEPADVNIELPSQLSNLQLGGRVLDPESGRQFLLTQEGLRPIESKDALRALEQRGAVRDINQPGAFLELSESQLGTIGSPINLENAQGISAVPDPFQPATSDVEGNVAQAQGDIDIDVDDITTNDMEGDVTMEDITSLIDQLEDAPEAPNLLDDFQALRSSRGIPALEAQLTDINSQIRELQASARLGLQKIEGETAPLTILSRQQQELQRQANEQIDFLGRRKQRIVDELNTKNQVIGQIMDLTQLDFQNANAVYGQNFDRKLGLLTLIKDYQTKEEQLANDEQDRALANWETLASFYEAKGLTWDTLSPDQQSTVESLAVKAGKPGLSQFIGANTAMGEIKSVTSRTDVSGNTYFDILRVGADGSVQVESVFRGQGGGKNTSDIDVGDEPISENEALENITAVGLSSGLMNNDGSLTKSARTQIIDAGVSPSLTDFIWANIITGKTLEQVRQLLIEQLEIQNIPNPRETAFAALDTFMSTLQSDSSGGDISNPFE